MRNIKFNNTYISKSDKKLLNSLNFPFDSNLVKVPVHKKVLLLTEFFKEFGRWPKIREIYKGIKIGYFFRNVKTNKTSITEYDRKVLNSLNFPFNFNLKKDSIHKKVLLLTEFFEEFGRWPKQREIYKDIKIGIFFKSIRLNTVSLTKSDREILNSLDFPFDSNLKKASVHKKVILLTEFFEEFGRWPKTKEVYKDIKIGTFSRSIRLNNISISDSDKELLNSLSFPFNQN